MAVTLTLADHSFIERKTARYYIRSHAMKGKVLGGKVRALRKRPRATETRRDTYHLLHEKNMKTDDSTTTIHVVDDDARMDLNTLWELDAPAKMPFVVHQVSSSAITTPNMEQAKICGKLLAHVGNDLSGLEPVCEMTTQSRRWVHDFLLYIGDALSPSVDFCHGKPDPTLGTWFKYMLADEAYFHCFVALSEACMDFVHEKDSYSTEYRHHMTKALRLLNNKLSSDKATADTSLAGVISLCLLTSLRGQLAQTKVHFDGLCRMIELRGGMDEIKHNPALIEKTLRIDIDLALQLGCPTRLGHAAKDMETIVPIFFNPAFEVRSPLLNAARNADADVFAATETIMKVSRLFNSGVAQKKLGPQAFQDIITTTCYRLLEIRPVGATRGTDHLHPVADAIQLALLAFMTTTLIQLGRQRRLRYEMLATKLMRALDNPQFQAAVDPATHLWLLVVAGISVLHRDDRVWLQPRLADAVAQFGPTQWSFARRLLGKYPWVVDLHDEPAAKLWASCFPEC
ncbi:uncharacterized protein J7T54_006283 [Emericellopsis cladophorae]|uniref:Uncharacterized protein n=1 Tax=Emericellopsis cladophorae TaxID=2686198 RepID=A0A9Q0BIQ9_9HYPO|nr:uncharacterized protein J7T54_006283 [Emericellopsis cladophorae]KAI6785944.1 hypothetical protein J7T54_006283 [Emericellopsis cladophorae]